MIRVATLLATAVLAAAASAAAPVAVSPPDRLATSPDLAVGPDGSVHALWVDKGPRDAPATPPPPGGGHPANYDVVVASAAGGAGFGPPVRVNPVAGEVWAFPTSRPRLGVTATGSLHVFYTANAVSPANGKPVLAPRYQRSTDGGRRFEPPRVLAAVPPGDLSAFMHGGYAEAQTFGTLLAHGTTVQVLWIDTRAMRSETDNGALYTAISRDDGAAFGADTVLFPEGVCPCCQLTAAAAAGERVYLGSREVAGGFRDSTVARSDDGGRRFGPRVRLGTDRWAIDGCPLKPTVVAVAGEHVYAAAYSGAPEPGGVRFAHSADGGRSFGTFAPVHPEAAVSDAPALLALGDGRVVLAWHGKLPASADAPARRRVFVRTGRDHGARWDPVVAVDDGTAEAAWPALAATADGAVLVAWVQADRIWSAPVAVPR